MTNITVGSRVRVVHLDGDEEIYSHILSKPGLVTEIYAYSFGVSATVVMDADGDEYCFELDELGLELTKQDVMELWEDTVGDSGEPPTADELVIFAEAVLDKWS